MPDLSKSTLRKLWSRATSAILHAIVDRVVDDKKFPRCQVEWLADRISPDVEYRQPQGVYFIPVTEAEGILMAPGGDRSTAVMLCAQVRSDSPGGGGIAEGEGGLYYAGEFKVFLDSAGLVHLGTKSGADFVALADLVHTEISNMLQAGVGAGGTGAANFTAAKTYWDAIYVPPATGVAATKVKAT